MQRSGETSSSQRTDLLMLGGESRWKKKPPRPIESRRDPSDRRIRRMARQKQPKTRNTTRIYGTSSMMHPQPEKGSLRGLAWAPENENARFGRKMFDRQGVSHGSKKTRLWITSLNRGENIQSSGGLEDIHPREERNAEAWDLPSADMYPNLTNLRVPGE